MGWIEEEQSKRLRIEMKKSKGKVGTFSKQIRKL
jgi:hypothetical protein